MLLISAIRVIKNKIESYRNDAYFVIAFILSVFIMEYGQVDYYQIFFMCLPIALSSLVDDYRLKLKT